MIYQKTGCEQSGIIITLVSYAEPQWAVHAGSGYTPDAEFIKEITASELLGMDLENLVIEPMVVELLKHADHINEVKILNCHTKGTIEKAIKGKNAGTIIPS